MEIKNVVEFVFTGLTAPEIDEISFADVAGKLPESVDRRLIASVRKQCNGGHLMPDEMRREIRQMMFRRVVFGSTEVRT